MLSPRCALFLLGCAGLLLHPGIARAKPQWNGALRAGIAGVGSRDTLWDHTAFHGSLYGDVLFGRDSSSSTGVGPFLQLGTAGFSDLRLAAGPSVLLPLSSIVAQLGVGGYLVPSEANGYGVHSQLFLGGRGYNFHAAYSPAIGVVLGADYGLSDRREVLLSVAVSIDLEYVALPFLILYGSLQSSD